MALIAKKLISTIAPILTYTMDELLEFAPAILKGDCSDIFDFKKLNYQLLNQLLMKQFYWLLKKNSLKLKMR